MKIIKLLIKSLAYALSFEILCFAAMYTEVKNQEHRLFALIALIALFMIFIVFASAFEFFKGKSKRNLLFIVPIFVIHLIATPCRLNYLYYINRYSNSFLKNIDINLMEIMVALFIATILL